ncbi:MAG: hypothetical protein L3K09_03820 [Thermoplasmata archaeon]|nr:hypothetical protein [Thermoplasmata archaeon]
MPVPDRERELAPAVCAYLAGKGYRVWVDPDGSDYFDLVCRRGAEVGLVELKLYDWKKLFAQAVRRRGFADWVAVALPRESLARKLLGRGSRAKGERIGVFVVTGEKLTVLREPKPWRDHGEANPFPDLARALSRMLDELEAGVLPEGVRWGVSDRSSASGRRSARDYRLEEFPEPEMPREADRGPG